MVEKLHEIIVQILERADKPLKVSEIATIIREKKLWIRPSDGKFPDQTQISARVNNYKHLFERKNGIVKLISSSLQKRLLRVTWNENLWELPSGHEWSKENQAKKDVAFENKHGFGGEEWLFNKRYNIDGFQYGYIRGLYEVTNIDFIDEVYLFSINSETKDRLLVAILRNVELLDRDNLPKKIRSTFEFYTKDMANELKAVNADYKKIKYSEFYPHVKFNLNDATIFDQPILVNELKEGEKYNRFKPYKIDATLEEFLKKLVVPKPGVFIPGKRNIKDGGHTRTTKGHTKEIVGLHNLITKDLEQFVAPDFTIKKKNISIERTFFGNNIADVVLLKKNGKHTIIEIKTSNNVRYNIREALGQLIDYLNWDETFEVEELIIISPSAILGHHKAYFKRIQKSLNIKLSYWEYQKDFKSEKKFKKY